MNDSNTVYNSTCPYMFYAVCTVAASLLAVMGLVGNIMIIMAFHKTRTLRTNANCYLVNMATSDMIFTLLAGPWIITEYFTGFKMFSRFSIEGTTGDFLCQSLAFVAVTAYTVSMLSNLLITKDRFIASVYPLKMSLITTKIRRILLSLTWILALVTNLPFFFYSSLHRVDGQVFCLIKENTFMFVFSLVDLILWYCVPLIFMSALYYKIINSLKAPGPGDSMRRHKQNRKVIKIVISIVVACFVCWTPYYVHEFARIANVDFLLNDKCSLLRILSYGLFQLLSTVINPVILFSFSTNYRSALRAFLTSCSLSQCKCSLDTANRERSGTSWDDNRVSAAPVQSAIEVSMGLGEEITPLWSPEREIKESC